METDLKFEKEGNKYVLRETNSFDKKGMQDLFNSFNRNWLFILENKKKTEQSLKMNKEALKRIAEEEEITRKRLESVIKACNKFKIKIDIPKELKEWLNEKKPKK